MTLVDTIIEDDRWQETDLAALAADAARATLTRIGLDPDDCEITVLACDDTRIAVLNADHRGKPQPTNVLSWPAEERGAETAGAMPDLPEPDVFGAIELGDIAIAYDTCQREAEAADKPLRDHALHLLVHGTLHLLGFDHIRDPDATLMEGLETEILGKMGIADPYRE